MHLDSWFSILGSGSVTKDMQVVFMNTTCMPLVTEPKHAAALSKAKALIYRAARTPPAGLLLVVMRP